MMFSLKQILGQHDAPSAVKSAQKSQDVVLKSLAQQVSQQQRLDHAWQQAAPALAKYSHATRIESDVLIVVAQSGLVANKIKLLAPQLITTLNDLINVNRLPSQRSNLTAIVAKVQVKSSLNQSTKRIKGLSKSASEKLSSFAQTTTNPKLAEAIKKLSNHRP